MIEKLYLLYWQELVAYCRQMEPAQAEDIAQEAFLRAMANLATLEQLDAKQRRAWLYKTARNLFFDRMRRKKMERERLIQSAAEKTENPFDAFETAQFLYLLPGEERALFTLRYLEGYNATELGQMYGVPASTIRARLAHARKIMQQKIMEDEENE